ncbi:MAG: hypothetical protein CVV34_00070 [Methanomicrobiales archaeon HGW-Methanomicrobiales-5]|jgi:tetratricopeptide (TPR) repeat protein|nr:MAG: hypothetical protein CVV34_00070 [Methanomicrobiales archaeon HGW-Methanomicrobiales-5]
MKPNLLRAGKHIPDYKEGRMAALRLASEFVFDMKYDEAKEVLTKLLDLNLEDTEVMTLLANVHFIEGNNVEAEQLLDKVLYLDPNNPQALYELGAIIHDNGEFDRAIIMFEKAIEYYKKDEKLEIAAAYQNLGCSLWEARRKDDALNAWKTCLKYNPKQKHARENLNEFMNEYGMPKSLMGIMDDYLAFTDLKMKEYLSLKGKDGFDDNEDASYILKKCGVAWNSQVLPEFKDKLETMKVKGKLKLFKKIKVFD